MVAELSARHALAKEVVEDVAERTGGVPLFVEEVTRLLLERGEQGGMQAIPPTLQQSLTARLDRLGSAREVAQIGAVIGRDFSYALLRAVAGIEDEPCKRRWNGSPRQTFCWCRACRPEADYRFKHALIQDAAYENLLKSRRQVLHRRVAKTLCDKFRRHRRPSPRCLRITSRRRARRASDRMVGQGRRPGASPLGLCRGDRASSVRRSSLAESLPDRPTERRRRLRLQIDYGQALIASRGHGAPETTAAFTRAEELATGSGDSDGAFLGTLRHVDRQLRPWRGRSLCGRYRQRFYARALAPDSPEYVMGHRIVGMSRWYEGDYIGAREHLEQALASYDPSGTVALAFAYGQDIGVTLYGFPCVDAVAPRRDRAGPPPVEEAVAYAPSTEHLATIASRWSIVAI